MRSRILRSPAYSIFPLYRMARVSQSRSERVNLRGPRSSLSVLREAHHLWSHRAGALQRRQVSAARKHLQLRLRNQPVHRLCLRSSGVMRSRSPHAISTGIFNCGSRLSVTSLRRQHRRHRPLDHPAVLPDNAHDVARHKPRNRRRMRHQQRIQLVQLRRPWMA